LYSDDALDPCDSAFRRYSHISDRIGGDRAVFGDTEEEGLRAWDEDKGADYKANL